MTIFLLVWISIGFLHWLDYMVRYNYRPVVLDFILGLPTFLLFGPLTTIRKFFQI